MIRKNEPRSYYEMIDMEWSEVMQFEVLAYAVSDNQTGLPQVDPHRPLTEEEWIKFDAAYTRIKNSYHGGEDADDEFYDGLMAQ